MRNSYNGKVCDKHPELNGERYARNRSCIGCERQRRLQRYYSAPKAENAKCAAWRKENREYQAARCRQWRGENAEHHRLRERKYYEANKEAILAQRRAKKEQSCPV